MHGCGQVEDHAGKEWQMAGFYFNDGMTAGSKAGFEDAADFIDAFRVFVGTVAGRNDAV
jgi:hypothetical protein